MEKKQIVAVVVIVFIICILGAILVLNAPKGRENKIQDTLILPHSGERINIELQKIANQRTTNWEFRLQMADQNISYRAYGGPGMGFHEMLNYSGANVRYVLERSQYGQTADFYNCTRGDCNILLTENTSTPLLGTTPQSMGVHGYSKLLCTPDGGYAVTYTKESSQKNKTGDGCPYGSAYSQ